MRWRTDTWSAEATGFYNDYDNLLGRDTLSGGGTGTGDLFNAGEVEIRGLEAALGKTWRFGGGELPIRATYSYTRGVFENSFDTSFADWSPRVEAGDRLPYLPEHQAFVEAGWRRGAWETFLNASFVDDVRVKAGQGPIEGSAAVENHLIWDLALGYRLAPGTRLTLDVKNLTDEIYLAARRPAGLRPGLPRSIRAGVVVDF